MERSSLLLHNIREYLSGGSGNVYAAGYFWLGDLYPADQNGNSLVMIHIDIPQLLLNYQYASFDITRGFSTMVHELQHLINATDSMSAYQTTGIYKGNDIWANEMMSLAAQHMIYGPLNERILSYNSSAKVRDGAVLTYESYYVNGKAELGANYGLPYLFGQYLRVQTAGLSCANGSGGSGIYKLILQSGYTDCRAVAEALSALGYGVTDFDKLVDKTLGWQLY